MTRIVPAVIITLVSLSHVRAASAEDRVAVLGLEASAAGASVDMETVKLATSLTKGLRNQASLESSPFVPAANANRGLTEMKLLAGCDDESTDCIARIGEALHAQYVIFGHVHATSAGAKLTLQLVNVPNKERTRGFAREIPRKSWDDVEALSQSLYRRIVGLPAACGLTIRTNASTGTLIVDGQTATISSGLATLVDLAPGRHRLAVESPGYQRIEDEITLKPGQHRKIRIELDAISSTAPPIHTQGGDDRTGSQVAFWAALSVGAAAGLFEGLNYFVWKRGAERDLDNIFERMSESGGNSRRDFESIIEIAPPPTPTPSGDRYKDVCGPAKSTLDSTAAPSADLRALVDACDRGDRLDLYTYASVGVMVVAGGLAGVFLYRGYLSAPDDEDDHRRTVRFSPTVTHDTVSAGVSIDF